MDNKDYPILRRNADFQFVERLTQLEEKLKLYHEVQQELQKDLDRIDQSIQSSLVKINTVIDIQQTYKPTIDSFSRVMSAGIVLRWTVIFVIGTLAAIGTMSTAIEVVQKWMK